jgi:hypothetical protein
LVGAVALPTIHALNLAGEDAYAGLLAYLVLDLEPGTFEGRSTLARIPRRSSAPDPHPAIATRPDA